MMAAGNQGTAVATIEIPERQFGTPYIPTIAGKS